MEVEPEKHEDGLDKDDREAWEVSSISQPPELQEPTGDSLDDVICWKFQYHTRSLTQTIFEMTQFKMSCGTYDPFWLISRLNTAPLLNRNVF